MRKELTKIKQLLLIMKGYNKFFILDGKKLDVENFDMKMFKLRKVLLQS